MNYNDYLKGESVFSHRQESEFVKAKKKIKNAMMSCILNKYNLSARETQVYKMFNYEGKSHREISEKLGIDRVTSRNYLYRANKKLKKISEVLEDENKNSR